MKNNNDLICESIAVLAIQMPNAGEFPFEADCEYIMIQYQRFLSDCIKIMQENHCMDIILQNHQIYGIYDGNENKTGRELEIKGIRIGRLVKAFNHNVEKYYAEKLLCGIGIAVGTAFRMPVKSPFAQKEMWMGYVFYKAYSMAQMSVCDGRRRVFIDDTAECSLYRLK